MSLMNTRINKRSHQACENCRRKKTRCPGERPACSTCTRLQQSCQYSRHYDSWGRPPGDDRGLVRNQEDRLQLLEEKMELMLEASSLSRQAGTPRVLESSSSSSSSQHNLRGTTSISSDTRETPTGISSLHQATALPVANTTPYVMPSQKIVAESIALYLQYCHKQPLWLFDPDELSMPENCPHEVVLAIASLALRYSVDHALDGRAAQMSGQYAEAARSLVSLQISRGTVRLSTMQSLCLIALAEHIGKLPSVETATETPLMPLANDIHLAWVHTGLVTSLAKCGNLDIELHGGETTLALEARRRLFWSIHFLNLQYGPRNIQLNMLHDINSPKYIASNIDFPREMGVKPPQAPQETGAWSPRGDIWVYMVQLASLWHEVQNYVSHCASGDLTPPWSVESGYSIIGSHLMNLETEFPTAHRYDSVRFQAHSTEELHSDRWYFSPWLYLQFTYHAVHSVINHPFLYSWRPQQSAQLAVPNTFWKTSSELALIHTTWTVRLIDMITEKDYQMSDPFLGHLVAIAATILLYYCRAADPAVRESAHRKVETCTRFLADLASKWPRCQAIYQNVQALIQAAFNASPNSSHHHHPHNGPRRTLSIDTALMWEILHSSQGPSSGLRKESLFDPSFFEPFAERHPEKVTVETEIFHQSTRTVDTSDGGQALPPHSSTVHDRAAFDTPEQHELLGRHSTGHTSSQAPLPREPLGWSAPGFQGDVSFMDITHDPFYQFQDHDNPYLGAWEIGNL